MRITESQLRRTIRKVLSEQMTPGVAKAVNDAINGFVRDPRRWQFASEDFYDMAKGGDASGVRNEYYPGWRDEDFQAVIDAVTRS